MVQIRSGVFETNSSSTHSICISTDNKEKLEFPESVHFRLKEFGWEVRMLDTVEEKAAYLYAGLIDTTRGKKELGKKTAWIMDVLYGAGVESEFDEPTYHGEYCWDAGVDHSEDLDDFLNRVMRNEKSLLRFLFSPRSFILTGNDNGYNPGRIKVDYPHEEYYKGN